MFCVTSLDPPFKIAFKVKDEEFDEISNRKGFMPAPYMARAKWVLVTESSVLTKKEFENFIADSYQLVKSRLTKKLRDQLGLS